MDDRALDDAALALAEARVIVYPTETLYGLGADAHSDRAIAALLALKGRDAERGLSVLVAGLDAASDLLARPLPVAATVLARRFWPGPLTLVLAACGAAPPALRGAGGGIGLRCSPDPIASALLARFGRPLTATSANPSGCAPARTIAEARAYFEARVAAYLDGGARAGALASTVVEFFEGRAYLRRAGAIHASAIRDIVELE